MNRRQRLLARWDVHRSTFGEWLLADTRLGVLQNSRPPRILSSMKNSPSRFSTFLFALVRGISLLRGRNTRRHQACRGIAYAGVNVARGRPLGWPRCPRARTACRSTTALRLAWTENKQGVLRLGVCEGRQARSYTSGMYAGTRRKGRLAIFYTRFSTADGSSATSRWRTMS